jgi:hypothetical protein
MRPIQLCFQVCFGLIVPGGRTPGVVGDNTQFRHLAVPGHLVDVLTQYRFIVYTAGCAKRERTNTHVVYIQYKLHVASDH